MTKVEALGREVANLSAEELAAFREWFSKYVSDKVTAGINEAVDATGDDRDHFRAAAATRSLSNSEWSATIIPPECPEARASNDPDPPNTAEQTKILEERWRAFLRNPDEGESWEEVRASLFSR